MTNRYNFIHAAEARNLSPSDVKDRDTFPIKIVAMPDKRPIDKDHLRSCALGGIPLETKLLASWDTCDIAMHQAEWLIEQAKEIGEDLDQDVAFQKACEDQDLYKIEWEYLLDHLTELIEERNEDGAWPASWKYPKSSPTRAKPINSSRPCRQSTKSTLSTQTLPQRTYCISERR